jgi:DNA-binding NtrC family response regulator
MGPVRVLIADPDIALLTMYRQSLQRYGFEVASASGGVECVARLRAFRPEVLVLEPDLLWGKGEGVLAVMRSEPELAWISVILLCAGLSMDELNTLVHPPVQACYRKPLMPWQLADGIWRLLNPDSPRPGAEAETARVMATAWFQG